MPPRTNSPLQAVEYFNKITFLVFIVCFAVVGYDFWLVSKAAQPPARVVISASQFSPQNVQIDVGQTVVWTNRDGSSHWIVSDGDLQTSQVPRLNSSGPILPQNSYSYTFDKSGTFTYHDDLHPNQLRGTITVK